MQSQYKNRVYTSFLLLGLALSGAAKAADNSVGLSLSTEGLGVSYSRKTAWHFTENDQIQLRFSVHGFNADDIEDVEVSNIDYDGDANNTFLLGGVDWFPFQGRFVNSIFFAGGISYSDLELSGTSKDNQRFSVGSTQVTPNDGRRIQTILKQDTLAPYLSLGWGNRIRETGGFAFRAELGLMKPFSDAEITVKSVGNQDIAQADLDAERRELEDDYGDFHGFFNLGVSYQF